MKNVIRKVLINKVLWSTCMRRVKYELKKISEIKNLFFTYLSHCSEISRRFLGFTKRAPARYLKEGNTKKVLDKDNKN